MTTPNYTLNPYIHFEGNCEEAIKFYTKTIGAQELMVARFKDAPPGACDGMIPPGFENKIMHARLRIGSNTFMLSDGGCPGKNGHHGFALSLTVPGPAEAETVFKALSEGGTVTMPLAKTFFSPAFGMVNDKFGIPWMVYVEGMQK